MKTQNLYKEEISMLNGKKNFLALVVATGLTLTFETTAFASPLIYDAEEGLGIEVEKAPDIVTYEITEGDKVSVSGGKLWASWKDGKVFRANYDHDSKTHRCSAVNDHDSVVRSEWTSKGNRAISPWLEQTLHTNRVFGKTK